MSSELRNRRSTCISTRTVIMFLDRVKGRGIRRFCAEFKHAHSPGIFKGIEVQLPLYMQNKNAEYGAYCVLYFKGDWFDKPKNKTMG